ncbi:MAG: retroviral-like aspartic protease family protein [Defluviitaleaceae bacterium]|nr:retroviral-like aspartic protease family protein [Defluviitaleaceae bacterium]
MRVSKIDDGLFWNVVAKIILRHNDRPIDGLKFKIDTGAGITTIPRSLLIDNGMPANEIKRAHKISIITADGKRVPNAYILRIPEIHVLGKKFINFEVATSLSVNMNYLLGQNILECFDWKLLYSLGEAIAEYRQGFVPHSMSSRIKRIDNLDAS